MPSGSSSAYFVLVRQARHFRAGRRAHRQRPDRHRGRSPDRGAGSTTSSTSGTSTRTTPQDRPAAVLGSGRLRRPDHRRHRVPRARSGITGSTCWVWADIIAPALFTMQAIGRWGNFFNQELFGPPTNLPWGIAIDCAHRFSDHGTPIYPCAHSRRRRRSSSRCSLRVAVGRCGGLFLIWLSRRRPYRLRPGDQILIFFIWYPIVRFTLETLRTGNWSSAASRPPRSCRSLFGLGSFLLLLYRHRGREPGQCGWIAGGGGNGACRAGHDRPGRRRRSRRRRR